MLTVRLRAVEYANIIFGVTAKKVKSRHSVPFSKAKLCIKLAKNLVFAVPPYIT